MSRKSVRESRLFVTGGDWDLEERAELELRNLL